MATSSASPRLRRVRRWFRVRPSSPLVIWFHIIFPKRIHIASIFFSIITVLILSFVAFWKRDQWARMSLQSQFFQGNAIKLGGQACKHPMLPLENPEISKHLYTVDPITCDPMEDWVYVNDSHAYINSTISGRYEGGIICDFAEIIRINDNEANPARRKSTTKEYYFLTNDFAKVSCTGRHSPGGGIFSRNDYWESFLAAPREVTPTPLSLKLSKGKVTRPVWRTFPLLNVLIWGHDSLSRNMFIRKLPLTYAYLSRVLHGVGLQGYNIVGDGTPQALIPLLTGKTELELPEARIRMGSAANHVDAYPFIWKDYKYHGYVTGFNEDYPETGVFTYRLKGFKDIPTDYYMRPYYVAALPHFNKYNKYCIGGTPRHAILMNYVRDIMLYQRDFPKFLFNFHGELSHDHINLIQGLDRDLWKFFQRLHSENILNNTVLIVMSDHGHRFSTIRETQQGKQEERMPMFMFVLPEWFPKVFPLAHANFVQNSDKLLTPFDIHATLLDLLRLQKYKEGDRSKWFQTPNDPQLRQMSMFRQMPLNRTCADAGVEPHWCACLDTRTLDVSSAVVQKAAHEIIDFLNHLTSHHRDICSQLKLASVLTASALHVNENLLRYKKNSDDDGFVADLSDQTYLTNAVIQLTLETIPGQGHYEVSVVYDLDLDNFHIKESDISRVNEYRAYALCLDTVKGLDHLRKYCHCRK